MPTPLVTQITVIFPQNVLFTQETRPLQFLVIQQIAENNRDLPIETFSCHSSAGWNPVKFLW